MKKRNTKLLKGGFNRHHLNVAFIVMEALGKDKIVLLPKKNEKRYDIVVDDKKNIKITNSRGHARMNVSKNTYINIKNFNIYVGSTTDTELILIDGNDDNLKNLKEIYDKIIEPENALMIIQAAGSDALITRDEEENLTGQINEIGHLLENSPAKLLTSSSPKQSNVVIDVIKLILNVLHLFFLIILKHMNKKRPKSKSPEAITALVVKKTPNSKTPKSKSPKSKSPEAITALVVSNNNNSPESDYEDSFNTILKDITEFPTYTDNGSNEAPTIKTHTPWKCVTPYSISNKDIQGRLRSCSNAHDANPDSRFENEIYTNRQQCIEKCSY